MKILKHPNPALNEVCTDVAFINNDILSLAGELLITMADNGGIGLAAPQVGKNINMFIIDTRQTAINGVLEIFINPTIKNKTGSFSIPEGCLSFSENKRVVVPRANKVKVEYTNIDKKRVTRTFEGINAVVVQHEYDHLLGVTMDHYEVK